MGTFRYITHCNRFIDAINNLKKIDRIDIDMTLNIITEA